MILKNGWTGRIWVKEGVVTFFNGYDVVGSAGDKILDDDKGINLMDVEFRYETEIIRWDDENHVQMKIRFSVYLQFK